MKTGISSKDKKTYKTENKVIPSISLPKGGGAIRNIDEKFSVNPVTGTGSISIPVPVSPGRSDFHPKLTLTYDSGAGNGPFGLGWHMQLPAITRKTEKGLPQYNDAEESDVFILSGAEDLVPVLTDDGRRKVVEKKVANKTYKVQYYRPRVEGLFARLERWTNTADPSDTFWRSISKDNITTYYGKTLESRIADPNDPSHIFSWLICCSYDDKGNAIFYEYKQENSEGVDTFRAHERNRTDKNRSANRYIKRIFYGNRQPNREENWKPIEPAELPRNTWMFEVVFDYGEHDIDNPSPEEVSPWTVRPDPFSTYRAGFEIRTYRLCQRILIFHHIPDLSTSEKGYDGLVRSMDFTYTYEENPDNARNPVYSKLVSIVQTGYKLHNGTYIKRSLPPIEFEYSEPVIQKVVEEVDIESLENLPAGLGDINYHWVDLHGEGIPGILIEQGGGWYYKRNLSPINRDDREPQKIKVKFAPLEQVALKPNHPLGYGRAQFMDLAGDGQMDLGVLENSNPGLYEHDLEEGWKSFRPFNSYLNLDLRDPNLRFIDITGDGRADILITEDEAIVWYPSKGEKGFGPANRIAQAIDEEKGPRLILAESSQSIFFADMSGDGLADIVRIRNGEVCYWPNLGYGRFGAKVTMDNSPWFDSPEQFAPARIRLADIDGSGTADIIYLAQDGIHIYFNQSGNSWSAPVVLKDVPATDNIKHINVVDLLGNGTACIVWSSPLTGESKPMRYLNLMGEKPHLLTRITNNMGIETRIQYAPSTKFYLADKLAKKPWITKLPFPVHVVEQVETYDHISRNRFVTRYAYHHGYFDGEEREFRGFGMVEQWDTEEFASLTETGELATNIDKASHVPPILTRTWFHTGIYKDRNRVSNYFAGLMDEKDIGEYYREPGLTDEEARALLLPDTVLPEGLTPEEEREACRALKSMMLRQEVYAFDGTDKEPHPYTVLEQNFTLKVLQPRGPNRHAVFFTHPLETITYHYERNPNDPRIQHKIILEVDEFGNVLKEVSIGYGRREKIRVMDEDGNTVLKPNPELEKLEPRDREKQIKTLITYTERKFTNAIDEENNYCTPLIAEERTYELTGYSPSGPADRFRASDFVNENGEFIFDEEIPYEAEPTGGRQRRLIECIRTYYRPDDLGESAGSPDTLLPLGKLESLALIGETYRLAFTPGLITKVFKKDGQALLTDVSRILGGKGEDEGGYVDLDGNGHWWIPSGRVFYSSHPNDAPSQELAEARAHFFLPRRHRDAFGNITTVTYDEHDLLILETSDPLGNRTTAGERDENGNIIRRTLDYRVLQPWLVSDPNRNRTAVAFDPLGMVVGTAVMGKPEENIGDSLEDFIPDLTSAEIDSFFEDLSGMAESLLGSATSRFIYDPDRFLTHNQPPFTATLARETHRSELGTDERPKIQVSFSYSDGFGREIQRKIQAEPGPVPKRDANGRIIVGMDGQPVMTDHEVSPRWVGSGWTVFNNKGKPVRQYEPFFTDTHRFEFEVRIGVSPILFYDPLERVVAKLYPNHTWEKIVFDPCRQETWDVNDTVLIDPREDEDVKGFFTRLPEGDYLPTWHALRTDQAHTAAFAARYPDEWDRKRELQAARKTEVHADTPTTAYFDTLGRTFLTVVHNRFKYSNAPADAPPDEAFYASRIVLDIEGNQREIIDAKNRVVMRYDYDMLGNRIHQASMEAGERWVLNDVAGNPIRTWDSRGFIRRMTYDALRRPTELYVTENSTERLVERAEYGEALADPEATNHRTRIFRQFDQAGMVTYVAYDFKGNLLESTRQLAKDYKGTLNWSGDVPLETETFTSRTTYDALNRPVEMITPDGSVIRPTYNEANLLERLETNLRGAANTTVFVANIDYNAKGQRERIVYGNGVVTTYDYDPFTFHLTRLRTTRNAGSEVLQDLRYTYDPSGNITHIRDKAQQTLYFNNAVVEPHADYTYDALYRLIEATGREHIGQTGRLVPSSWDDALRVRLPHPQDGQAMRRYTERYEYDAVGNFLRMIHQAPNGSWTREYAYEEPSLIEPAKTSNRLSSTRVGDNQPIEPYSHDAHGNMTSMPHLPLMRWNFNDQLQATARQVRTDGGTPETTYYVYDASGQRVRKVTERQAALGEIPTHMKERIYLGGFEIYREYENDGTTVKLERQTLHIMDDTNRIALVEIRTKGTDPAPQKLIRYQFGNHLGSVSLELDEKAKIISYEEYYPYGSTSYQAVRSQTETPKRYRYTGKERDEESGLYYHGARYYACWLGRWVSCDPAGLVDGVNLYRYNRNNPVIFKDSRGLNPQEDEEVNLGPFRLRNIQLTGLSGGARLGFGLHGVFTDEPLSLTVNTASLSGQLTVRSDFAIPSLGLESGTGTYHLNLQNISIADETVRANIRGQARIETGPLSISFLAYADITAHLDSRIVLSRWREHLSRTMESMRGSVEAFAILRLFGHEVGSFALRSEFRGGGKGTTSLSGWLSLGHLIVGRIHGTGTFTTGHFLGEDWIPGSYSLSGPFWVVGPGVVCFGSWSFDLNQGLSATGHYFGPQFGPFSLDLGLNPTGNVNEDTAYWRFRDAMEAGAPSQQGAVLMYEPGMSFGYTYFNYSSTSRLFVSVGFSPSSSVVPYYHGGVSQPEIPGLNLLGIGPSLPDEGWYMGGSLNLMFNWP